MPQSSLKTENLLEERDFRREYNKFHPDEDIAATLGVSEYIVERWRRRHGLGPWLSTRNIPGLEGRRLVRLSRFEARKAKGKMAEYLLETHYGDDTTTPLRGVLIGVQRLMAAQRFCVSETWLKVWFKESHGLVSVSLPYGFYNFTLPEARAWIDGQSL